ncbi:MAG: S8 family serine peptidase [Bdellovibrionales bacterium]|nr:S8 family serine peptidase [Bdellovibrionales bacterium]
MVLRSGLFLCLGFCSALAGAEVFVDRATTEYLHSSSAVADPSHNTLLLFEQPELLAKPASLGQLIATNSLPAKRLMTAMPQLNANVLKLFPLINGVGVRLSRHNLRQALELPGLKSVERLDEPVFLEKQEQSEAKISRKYPYAWGIEKVGAKQIHQEYPELRGEGVRIGVLDTGIKANHRDLEGKVLHFKNFSAEKNEEPADEFDHGTHIAGTLVGGTHSRRAIGVAPGAMLVVARIFDRGGESSKEKILEAMHWMVDPDEYPETDDSVHIVNGSWGTRSSFSERSPEDVAYCEVVASWADMGVIPVFAAGNNGPAKASIGLPGGCPGAVSVGSTEHSDRLMYFSAVGPAQWQDFSLNKPELTAPGFKIYSASSNGRYREQLGTSMSAPHVAGIFALLRQAHPEVESELLISTVIETAKDLGPQGYDVDFGFGRIQGLEAMKSLERQTQ